METKSLWSWLVRSEARTEVFVPSEVDLTVTNEQYAEALRAQALANRLPVDVREQLVVWDDSNTRQTRVLVQSLDPRLNAVLFLTGIDRFGSFYYIEEKLFWDKPSLPSAPATRRMTKPTEVRSSSPNAWKVILGFGIFCILGVLIAAVFPLLQALVGNDEGQGLAGFTTTLLCLGVPIFPIGAAAILYAVYDKATAATKQQRRLHRYEAELQEYEATRAYDTALTNWIERIKEADYKSRTDDEFGRFNAAVRSTVRQTIQKLFIDRHAELRERKEKELSRQELEAELEKRKSQGFQ